MKALAIVGFTVVGIGFGWMIGATLGDRKSQYLDFGTPVLFGGLVGALVGALAGTALGAAVLTW